MAIVWKNRIRKEVPDADVSVWEKSGWSSTSVAAPVKSNKPKLQAVVEDNISNDLDRDDSSINLEKE